jgi:hypothetical protein
MIEKMISKKQRRETSFERNRTKSEFICVPYCTTINIEITKTHTNSVKEPQTLQTRRGAQSPFLAMCLSGNESEKYFL